MENYAKEKLVFLDESVGHRVGGGWGIHWDIVLKKHDYQANKRAETLRAYWGSKCFWMIAAMRCRIVGLVFGKASHLWQLNRGANSSKYNVA
jgi:hypothetical protein